MGKPMVLEEFGMARDAWRDPSMPLYKYNPGTATTNKDTYYQHLFRLIQKLAAHGASAGANFWAYSGEGYPSDSPNSFDMVWIGGKLIEDISKSILSSWLTLAGKNHYIRPTT
jgi:mannan endo-1,4-beta-mannosidase